MNELKHKNQMMKRRVARTRANISGSQDRPRLSVNISNLHVTAQIIDDSSGKTLVYASTVGKKMPGTMTEKAAAVGSEIANLAKKVKIQDVVFDRGAKKYQGRVKALADAARKEGLGL